MPMSCTPTSLDDFYKNLKSEAKLNHGIDNGCQGDNSKLRFSEKTQLQTSFSFTLECGSLS